MTLPRIDLAPGLSIPRIVTGLWQVADQERDGRTLDREAAADALAAYAAAGFDGFDMADHYGSAELIAGALLARHAADDPNRPRTFTKWCPTPGPMTRAVVRAGIERARSRLGVDTVDLLQFHWWTFEHLAYLDAARELAEAQRDGLVAHLGTTNFDTAHLRVLIGQGVPIVSNQVSFSLLDRRAAGAMSAFCLAHGVKLLAYGTLAGGLLSERWLGRPEPDATSLSDWSKSKYKRFVDALGGWGVFQAILAAAGTVATRHGVSIANVATRWVLDHPAVAAVIVGARLAEAEHRADNARTFAFALDDADRATLDAALSLATPIPGDCGDEYRRPPFLTASGDLSHHLAAVPRVFTATPVPGRPNRTQVDSGSVWEPIAGYSRAVRVGERVLVSGTTATHGAGTVVCADDPGGQATFILDKIAASLAALGASMEDVVRTRVYLQDADDWEAVSRAHGAVFGSVRPANTLLEVGRLVGPYRVEIEAEAVVEAT
ncbi:aldo/keto reductase [Lichenihabitans sp. Uapishka_5]|uniref:aldo/keto reductase n=1 Tax=Lichenihabitans sp. Uapishka_5 TaxID=3037302 RepID=UPI0029E7D08E|nr:aldo/keto reductase [Lichenihabitans sp. Uapishka_5]MDX7951885.1 aldo/keto reductase [Lichenihabitans sp. Uapishka_5]